MTPGEDFTAGTERLLAHARKIAGFDEARRQLEVQFDSAVAAARADHAFDRSSSQIARVAELVELLDVIDRLALEEIEHCATTLSEVTVRGPR